LSGVLHAEDFLFRRTEDQQVPVFADDKELDLA
jgi:hypothetical protein